jgi:hypothetical protein
MYIKYVTNPIDIGHSFVYKGYYCTVKSYSQNGRGFWYEIQEKPERKNYMSFKTYIETPSYKSRNRFK